MGAFVFGLGLIAGSFCNVCIWRIPRKESIIKPSSYCPNCGMSIKWYDNIPILSFIILGGKCRYCREKISFRYPLVELTTAVLLIIFYKQSFSGDKFLWINFLLWTLALVFLIIISGIDYYHQIIPDVLSFPLLGIGLGLAPFNKFLHPQGTNYYFISITGTLLFGLLIYGCLVIGEWVFKKEAMGGGDVKLVLGLGALIGYKNILWAIFLSSLLGGIVSLVLIYLRKKTRADYIPFGPFLCAGSLLSILLKNEITRFYQWLI